MKIRMLATVIIAQALFFNGLAVLPAMAEDLTAKQIVPARTISDRPRTGAIGKTTKKSGAMIRGISARFGKGKLESRRKALFLSLILLHAANAGRRP